MTEEIDWYAVAAEVSAKLQSLEETKEGESDES